MKRNVPVTVFVVLCYPAPHYTQWQPHLPDLLHLCLRRCAHLRQADVGPEPEHARQLHHLVEGHAAAGQAGNGRQLERYLDRPHPTGVCVRWVGGGEADQGANTNLTSLQLPWR